MDSLLNAVATNAILLILEYCDPKEILSNICVSLFYPDYPT